MNFKKFNDIGDSEPRAWKPSFGTRFDSEDDECDEVPGPYCDDCDDIGGTESDTDDDCDDAETETETDSVKSNPLKRIIKKIVTTSVLQEEFDFLPE
jgi:hypothetical protein